MVARTTTTRLTATMSVVSSGIYNLRFCGFNDLMTEISNTPIYHKLYQFTKRMYIIVHNMPKEYKYTLGEDSLHILWECLDIFMLIRVLQNRERRDKIKELSVAFDRLKARVRMMQEINLISERQFADLQENYILPTGKMIGGWYNWSERQMGR